ncbi:MAG: hypothetical protein IJZ79_07210 [Bacilli bacterium]|nr:hypothetical protein [Bacilli bacterium]
MMEVSQQKKKIFYVIVLILTLICLLVSATIAYFHLVASQKENGTVLYTGTLDINYIDGVYIKDPLLYPMKTVNYNTYNDVYRNTFSVESKGTLDQNIKIDLIVARNDFEVNALKYVIFNENGNELSTGFVPKNGKVTLTENMYLASNDIAKYTLIIWLDDTDYNQNFETESIINGSISVHAVQVKY